MKKFLAGLCALWSKFLRKLRQPQWRHGRWSILILSGFIAVSVLINIGVESLEKTYGWRKDYSFNGYATTGAETQKMVNRLTKSIDIYLLYQSGQMDSQLLELLNRYAGLSTLIHVKPTDIAKNPGILTRFQGDLDTAVEADTVIVHCEATGRYKVLTYNDFVTQGYNYEEGTFEVAGLAYEKQLTESLVYVTEDTIPVVGILQGHGELTLEKLKNFTDFLRSNNYDYQAVSLLGGSRLDGIDLLLVAGPQKDWGESELSTVDAFIKGGGSLLVLRDYTDPMDLPNYLSFLKSYGVIPLPGVVIAGEEDEGSYYGERIYLLPYMCELDMTLPLLAGKLDILLLAGAGAFENPPEPSAALTVATVLKSGPHAYLRDPSDGNTSMDKQAEDRTGELSLALYAHRMHPSGNISRLFAIGNSTLFTDEYIYQRTFNQEFMLQLLGQLLPQKTVSLDILASAAFHPGLLAGSQTLGLALIIGVPLLTLIAALCMLLPRRNR